MLDTVATGATASYLAGHAGASGSAATVHGFAVAMVWGVAFLLVALVPIGLLVGESRRLVMGEEHAAPGR